MWYHLTGFVACAAIIFFAGKKLSLYGDMLADLTGIGKAWIGLILMAGITSLPELMVGISSAAVVQSPDLAVGDIMGSCVFNLGILSLMDIFTPKDKPLFTQLSNTHVLAASFGIILVSMAGLGIFLSDDIVIIPWLGLTSFGFAVVYFLSVKTLFQFQKNCVVVPPVVESHKNLPPLKKVIWYYFLFAVCIIVAALAVPFFAEKISDNLGWSKAFTGTLLLAVSTSLPEIAVSIAAIRIGSADMAAGNLLGSNIFNIFILFIDDLVYTRGHILKDASDGHLVSVFFVIIMSGVAMAGLMFPSKQKKWQLSWDAFIILMLYIFNMVLLFKLS